MGLVPYRAFFFYYYTCSMVQAAWQWCTRAMRTARSGVACAALALTVESLWSCQAAPRTLTPYEGIVVHLDRPAVEIQATTCLDTGWLEQIACSANTREHESLVVVEVQPSKIHASLLLAGFLPGAPGQWNYEDDVLAFTPPSGDRLEVLVRYEDASGRTIEESIRTWIQDDRGLADFPDDPWVFAGSETTTNPEFMGPGTLYVADLTGSIVGLVTFGDEVIGFSQVLADESAVQPPQWQVRTGHVPQVGTPVTLILRRAVQERSALP